MVLKMLIKHPEKIPTSDITPEPIYHARRDFMRGMFSAGAIGAAGVSSLMVPSALAAPGHVASDAENKGPDWLKRQIAEAQADTAKLTDTLTPYEHVTQYNNFYEFGMQKDDPAKHSKNFKAHSLVPNIRFSDELQAKTFTSVFHRKHSTCRSFPRIVHPLARTQPFLKYA